MMMEFHHLNFGLIVILYFPSLYFLEVETHFLQANHTHRRVKRNNASDTRKVEETTLKNSQKQNQAPNALKNVNPGSFNPVLQIPSTIIKILPRNRNQQHQTPQNEPTFKRKAPTLIQNSIPIQIGNPLKNYINLNDTENTVKNVKLNTQSEDFNSTNKIADISLGSKPEIYELSSPKTYNISRNSPGKPIFHSVSVYENNDSTDKSNINQKYDEPDQSKNRGQAIEEHAQKQQKMLSGDNLKEFSKSQDSIMTVNNTNVTENVAINEETNKYTNNQNKNKDGSRYSETTEGSNIKPILQKASPKTEYVIKKKPALSNRGPDLKKETKNRAAKKTKPEAENEVSDTSITESLNIIRDFIEKLKSPDIANSISLNGETCGRATAEVVTDLNDDEEKYESAVPYSEKFGYEDFGKTPLYTREQIYPVQSDIYYKNCCPYDSYTKNSQYNTYSSPNWSNYVQPVDSYQNLTPAGNYQNYGQGCNKNGLKEAYYVLNVKPKNIPKISTYEDDKIRNPEQLIKNKDCDAIIRSRTDTELIIKGKTVEPSRIGAWNQYANDKKAINVPPSTLNQNQGLININGLYRNQNIPTYACLK